MSEIKEYPKCIEHNTREIKEEIPAKKGVVDDSIENVRGYLSAANEALREAYEHIDYSYPIQIAERKSQTIARRCTAMILRAQTDSSFKPNNWGYAMINAIDMINLTPTKRGGYWQTASLVLRFYSYHN